ncbi:hypothetical protein BGZ93_008639 [Podila epicladia]|nr:hypothetical protein BGZ93_008639 [Podila epicladia]
MSRSPLSAGSGPIKTEPSLRRHRFSAGYQGHHTRRQSNSQHPNDLESTVPYHLPSPTSPSSLARNDPPSSAKAKISPLLKIPYPNLTLTLALIYVDRLKAKYPEARGEPGCSHRLFLVAYIIASKYRCSVELAGMLQSSGASETNSEAGDGDVDGKGLPRKSEMETQNQQESWDYARSKAKLILSNHEWIRLLRLGSFFRPPVSPATPGATEEMTSIVSKVSTTTSVTARTSPAQPMIRTSSSSSRDGAPVEDLDRMETEFLTFLDYDLSTRSQDLNTCWNLLVGEQ